MADPPKIGGYIWKQELNRAMRSNQAAQEALRRITDDQPGPQQATRLQLTLAQALANNLGALLELQQIDPRDAHRDQPITSQEARQLLAMTRLDLPTPEQAAGLQALNAQAPVDLTHRRRNSRDRV